ncbi:MAG TPA: hypothetical protein VM597_33610 [Gemmataceae bacterium]|jgi:hypothetical protein|nr:hypothetical protein [Gemmataceae bacterium]
METGGGGKGQVSRIEADGRAVTPEDVWNAAIRAGVDPARMALSLCHVLGEAMPSEDDEDEVVPVRYTLKDGQSLAYDASFHNPFKALLNHNRPSECCSCVHESCAGV